jgi:DNA-binding NtrC family response regulator
MYRLLIADNKPEWRKFSQQVLGKKYDVVSAETIDELTASLEGDGYDLILVNVEMMRGEFREPIHRLFQKNLDKPIIVVSVPALSHQDVQETRTAFKLGAKDCVEKPFSPERLLTLIHQLLEEFVRRPAGIQGVQT